MEIFRGSSRHLLTGTAMKYRFIEQHAQQFPVVTMCRVLSVSESGYYAWHKRPASHHQREDARLRTHIQQIFVESRASPDPLLSLHKSGSGLASLNMLYVDGSQGIANPLEFS